MGKFFPEVSGQVVTLFDPDTYRDAPALKTDLQWFLHLDPPVVGHVRQLAEIK